ncbi:MAG TPA: HAD family hydrolase, partial [Marinobacter sp.]|nr:HAD family hydrolase [Marinobacter sp.]
VVLFDWHATLVDTLDAMYHAVDDMLPDFHKLNLMQRMVAPEDSKTPEDARLVAYVREFAQLHPKVKADRKISRTDIFEVLFGDDQEAKQIAHKAFNHHYRNHYGTVNAFEPKVRDVLAGLPRLNIQVGVITNRDREFFEHELAAVEETGWADLFDVNVCGDDTLLRKPHPDQLLLAVQKLDYPPDPSVWYVGDSTTDVIAAKRAGMTSVFFNGAQWDLPWLNRIFPGTHQHPDKPDVVVNDFSEFWALVLACEMGPP